MGRYVLRRLLQMAFVLLGATFLVFAMVYALPGDPLAGKCGERPCSAEYVRAETERLHLNDPLPVQYGHYLKGLAQGDFGTTAAGDDVLEEIKRTYPVTLRLGTIAIIFVAIVGVGAGVLAGVRRNGLFDRFSLAGTLLVISLPIFVIGTTMQYFLGIKLGLFPVTATTGSWGQLIMPGMAVGSLSLAYATRITRTSVAENLRADYVRTARAKGMPERRVVGIHTMRNSMIPIITFLGTEFGGLLGGAIVTEGIFNIPGIGGLVFRGISLREGALVVGVSTFLILIFLLVSLIIDLLYAVLDPRIRYE
ncbi:ABC transporter permease [Sporichthya polymorpha]|uniref:ABC transporter permease n=1 Tax=Sporichthya polymorpha TaxID=35751 RepID=UPI00048DDA42|nr:ABC transporter permease [Sporichthya polymorpha]